VAIHLPVKDNELLRSARRAAERASAPYSNFPVGAAVEAANGRVYLGCNIESASYGLTICAERVAIFSTIADGAVPARLAVSCPRGDRSDVTSLTPCGACRQIMLDQMKPDAPVWIDGVGQFTVIDLLPLGFRLPHA